MDPVLRIGNTCDFERMPNGRLRIVPRVKFKCQPLGSHPNIQPRDEHVVELELTEVYKLVQWLNKFPTQK